MNELTMEERADILSLYRKTDCILIEKHNDPYRMLGEVGTQHKVNGIIISLQESGMANFQLILTPLSDITDEDAIEVAKIIMRRHNRHYKDGEVVYKVETEKLNGCPNVGIYVQGRTKGSYSIRIEPDAVCLMKHKDSLLSSGQCFHVPNQYEATDFLRSRSYALPYKGVDLYQAGIAVKPNKTNSNE